MTTSINAFLLNTPYQIGNLRVMGAWSNTATYAPNDVVSYTNGSSYVAIQGNTNQNPTNTTYWQVLALGANGVATTKGDIVTFGTTTTRLPAGNDGEAVIADSTTATGNRFFPAQINVQKMTLGGHSYLDPTSGLDYITSLGNYDYSLEQSLLARLYEAFDIEQGKVVNLARSGSLLTWDAYRDTTAGGWQTILQAPRATPRSGDNKSKPATSPDGLCIGMWGINDVDHQTLATVGANRAMFKHALRTVISRWRSGIVYETTDSASGITKAGDYTQVTEKFINSGTGYMKLNTVGTYVEIATPSNFEGGTVALGFIGAPTNAGGVVNITLNGSNVSSINGVPGSTFSTHPTATNNNRYGMVARINVPNAGANTIRITVTSLGTALYTMTTATNGTFTLVAPQVGAVLTTRSGGCTVTGTVTVASVAGNTFTVSGTGSVTLAGDKTVTVASVGSVGVGTSINVSSAFPPNLVTITGGVDGVATGQFITSSVFPAGTCLTTFYGYNLFQLPVFLTNNAPTSTGDFASNIAPSVDFDYWQVETNYPNPIIIANIANAAVNLPYEKAIEDYNADIASVVGEFPAPIALADIQNLLSAGTNRSTDGVHPSRVGAQFVAEALRLAYIRSGATLHDSYTPSAWNIKNSAPGEAVAPLWAYEGSQGFIGQRLANSSSNITLTRNFIYCVPVLIPQPCTIDQFIVENVVSAGGSGTVMRCGLYMDYRGFPWKLISDFGTVSGTGKKTITVSVAIQTPGLYWMLINPQSGSGADPVVTALTGGDRRVAAISSRNPSCLVYGNSTSAFFGGIGTGTFANANANGGVMLYPNTFALLNYGRLPLWASNDLSPVIYMRVGSVGA